MKIACFLDRLPVAAATLSALSDLLIFSKLQYACISSAKLHEDLALYYSQSDSFYIYISSAENISVIMILGIEHNSNSRKQTAKQQRQKKHLLTE